LVVQAVFVNILADFVAAFGISGINAPFSFAGCLYLVAYFSVFGIVRAGGVAVDGPPGASVTGCIHVRLSLIL
jgi:hypothetical protein